MTVLQASDIASGLERKSPTEGADVDEIVRGMLAIQAQAAASGKRPLSRGTHAKGICVRAEFEVFDLGRTIADPGLASRLAKGAFARPGCVSGDRPFRERRRRASARQGPGRPRDVLRRRLLGGRDAGSAARRFFDEQRDHIPDQRRACLCGRGKGPVSAGRPRQAAGTAIAVVGRGRQFAAHDVARPEAAARHTALALPAAALLEHGAISFR